MVTPHDDYIKYGEKGPSAWRRRGICGYQPSVTILPPVPGLRCTLSAGHDGPHEYGRVGAGEGEQDAG